MVAQLCARGWKLGDTVHYDTELALYTPDIQLWLETAMPQKWLALQAQYGDDALSTLAQRVATSLASHGTLHVLRQGVNLAGCGNIDLSEAAPEDLRNEDVVHRYRSNILRVVPQLKYHPTRNYAIDLVFFINGLPVATVELKTDFTQSVELAMDQYRNDRLPVEPKTRRKEPLLTPRRGAVVHFAMSDSEIYMTTKLAGQDTVFLPFNAGNNGYAGNAARADGEYAVAYFWERVCQPDAWLEIFHSFAFVRKRNKKGLPDNTLVFPRFHQWDSGSSMVKDANKNGPGMSYLADHSAGSGKTNTISWTAHGLIRLRSDIGKPIFNGVIIVTDRTILDSQLQDAVQEIDHKSGVVKGIDNTKTGKSKSELLTQALLANTPIIIVTIQTFPWAMEAIISNPKLKDNSYGVIIDEAHASQTGTTAAKLQAALSMSGTGEVNTANMTIEEILGRLQNSRSKPSNISYFAFTGTPKHSTMMLFGRPANPDKPASKKNLPVAFHRYTMRQAIEEGFILDVLKGYMPYTTALRLSKVGEDNRRVSAKDAKRALAEWINLHPTNVTQKVQFIMKHFDSNVADRLKGQAKAMVVTSSRAAAIRYKKAMDAYISSNEGYEGYRSLIAFSGSITGKQIKHSSDSEFADDVFGFPDEQEYTEYNMNPQLKGADIAGAFATDEYRVMLVADKFQTGFDQPKLVALYVDKKIANEVEIVQTFSRVNRTFPGKDEVFIIDFVNEPEQVQKAFELYDQGAQIMDVQDPNVVYDIKERLDGFGLYTQAEVDEFKVLRFSTLDSIMKAQEPDHKKLRAALDPAARRYNEALKGMRANLRKAEENVDKATKLGDTQGQDIAKQRVEAYSKQIRDLMAFKQSLWRFVSTYNYVSQLMDFGDPELESFAAFAKLLEKLLNGMGQDEIDLTGLMMSGYSIKPRVTVEQEIGQEPVTLTPVGAGGAGRKSDEPEYMQIIIGRLNMIFGDVAPSTDQQVFAYQIAHIVTDNKHVKAQVDKNTRDQAMKGHLPGSVQQGVVRALSSHQALASLLLKADKQSMEAFTELIYDMVQARKSNGLEQRQISLGG